MFESNIYYVENVIDSFMKRTMIMCSKIYQKQIMFNENVS